MVETAVIMKNMIIKTPNYSDYIFCPIKLNALVTFCKNTTLLLYNSEAYIRIYFLLVVSTPHFRILYIATYLCITINFYIVATHRIALA